MPIPYEPPPPVVSEFRNIHLDDGNSMPGKNLAASLVIQATLFAAGHAAHSLPAVEELDSFRVLPFTILDYQIQLGVPSVDGQRVAAIPQQEGKAMLALGRVAEDFIAKVDHIGFVGHGARLLRISCLRWTEA